MAIIILTLLIIFVVAAWATVKFNSMISNLIVDILLSTIFLTMGIIFSKELSYWFCYAVFFLWCIIGILAKIFNPKLHNWIEKIYCKKKAIPYKPSEMPFTPYAFSCKLTYWLLKIGFIILLICLI